MDFSIADHQRSPAGGFDEIEELQMSWQKIYPDKSRFAAWMLSAKTCQSSDMNIGVLDVAQT